MALVSSPDARPPNENMGLVDDPLEFVVVVIGELVMLEVPFRNIGPAGNGSRPAMDGAAKPVPDNVVPSRHPIGSGFVCVSCFNYRQEEVRGEGA